MLLDHTLGRLYSGLHDCSIQRRKVSTSSNLSRIKQRKNVMINGTVPRELTRLNPVS